MTSIVSHKLHREVQIEDSVASDTPLISVRMRQHSISGVYIKHITMEFFQFFALAAAGVAVPSVLSAVRFA